MQWSCYSLVLYATELWIWSQTNHQQSLKDIMGQYPGGFSLWKWRVDIITITMFNSLAPGRLKWNISWVIFKLILVINGLGISPEITPRWMSQELNKSTLVQVMAWCRQATSHYLSQCWPRSMFPYGVRLGHNELMLPTISPQIINVVHT